MPNTPLEVKLISQGAQQAAPVAVPDEREAFEAKFPMPSDCRRVGNTYAATEFNAWQAQAYGEIRKGWLAALEFLEGRLESLSTPPAQRSHAVIDVLEEHAKRRHQWLDAYEEYGLDNAVIDEAALLLMEVVGIPVPADIDFSEWLSEEDRNMGRRAALVTASSMILAEIEFMDREAAPGDTAAPEQDGRVEELAALARQLVHALRKAKPAHKLPGKALDYLKRKGLAGNPLRAEQAEQPIKWGSAGTVGNLIAQLRTIDPSMPVYASLRVKNGVRDGVMLVGLIISYEHGDGRFIVKDGPEKCVVIWTQPDDRQAEQDAVKVPAGITIDRDLMGTMHIKCGDFDFIQIQYQYPYTDNASTRRLAEQIAALLGGDA
ncbi:MAG: hypothetical protein A2002_04730 [Pseudomonadales bacterium GWC1_66_9]|nr:MAG: hypothetical protein A2002_04730 [Pseudomonadales bacterium GWC1_66_9]